MGGDRIRRAGEEFVLGSPNRMVWQHFEALRRLVARVQTEPDQLHQKQDVMVGIGSAIAAVETFLNVFFRVAVTEPPFHAHAGKILRDLERRAPLEHKLRRWPPRLFGRGLDFDAPTAKAFMELRKRRSDLLDFTSSHETLELNPTTRIEGLADVAVFERLTAADAVAALEVAEGLVAELLALHGVGPDQMLDNLRLWTGKAPE